MSLRFLPTPSQDLLFANFSVKVWNVVIAPRSCSDVMGLNTSRNASPIGVVIFLITFHRLEKLSISFVRPPASSTPARVLRKFSKCLAAPSAASPVLSIAPGISKAHPVKIMSGSVINLLRSIISSTDVSHFSASSERVSPALTVYSFSPSLSLSGPPPNRLLKACSRILIGFSHSSIAFSREPYSLIIPSISMPLVSASLFTSSSKADTSIPASLTVLVIFSQPESRAPDRRLLRLLAEDSIIPLRTSLMLVQRVLPSSKSPNISSQV